VTEEETGTRPPLLSRLWQSHVRVTPAPSPEKRSASSVPESTTENAIESTIENIAARFSAPENGATEAVELPLELSSSTEPAAEFRLPPPPLRRAPDTASSLPERPSHDLTEGAAIDPTQSRRLPRLRVVGQLSQSYIVTEGEDGMYLIDQHAAHERILLERMVATLKASTPLSQHLLTPLALDLAPTELEAIEDHQQQLMQIGFDLEIVDGKTLEMRAVPNVLVKQMNARSLHELLIELTAAENLGHTETWEERALANVACKAAIKQNYFLTVSEMREMIEQLEQTKAPYSCCHGRPTMVHFSLSALEREFGRR
jgi:DNA mismatch repair protein MutL